MGNKIYLTKEGLKKLKEELEFLKTSKRLEIADKLKEAISYGDLSENSEYEDARNEQAQVEVRISDLEDQLKNYEIIDEKHLSKNSISMGSVVEIENIKTKEKSKFKIVGTMESDILSTEIPTISNESPIGMAILGKNKGDNFDLEIYSGSYTYKVLNFS